MNKKKIDYTRFQHALGYSIGGMIVSIIHPRFFDGCFLMMLVMLTRCGANIIYQAIERLREE